MTRSRPDRDPPRAALSLHRANFELRRGEPGLLRSTRSLCRGASGLARSKELRLLSDYLASVSATADTRPRRSKALGLLSGCLASVSATAHTHPQRSKVLGLLSGCLTSVSATADTHPRRSKVLGMLVGCLGLLSGRAVYADSADLDAVLHSLAARRHGEVSFVEQHFLSMLKRPVESSGELIYDAPDHLEKRTVEPRPESLVLQGRILTAQRGRSTHVLDLKSYPEVWPLIESIRATLAGDRAALEQRFNVEFGGDRARWVLVLTPRDAEVAKAVSRVQIDGAGDDLTRVEIRQPDGDRSLMTLRPLLHP